MNYDILFQIEKRHGAEVRAEYERLAQDPSLAGASDLYLLDKALYRVNEKELTAAAADSALPFASF